MSLLERIWSFLTRYSLGRNDKLRVEYAAEWDQDTFRKVRDSLLKNNNENLGMWCRMCGGACDLENCGMEQP